MVYSKKSLGQNYLKDENVATHIVESINIQKTDLIIEIGAGFGALTKYIVKYEPAKLIIIELDNNHSERLKKDFKNAVVINEDAVKIDFSDMLNKDIIYNKKAKIISNLPYNASSKILENLTKHCKKIDSMTLMFQKELADRIKAKANCSEYGRISLLAQEYFIIEEVMQVNPESFIPKPKIISSVLKFTTRNKPLVEIKNRKLYDKIIKTTFSSRRKMIRKSLKTIFEDEILRKIFIKTKISPKTRPQDLSIYDFVALSEGLG